MEIKLEDDLLTFKGKSVHIGKYSLVYDAITYLLGVKELLSETGFEGFNPDTDSCDVEGCYQETISGGNCWKETGYWRICRNHSDDFRKDKPQPKMKERAIKREASRDKETGFLPSVKKNSKERNI